MQVKEEKRESIRTQIRGLTSIVKNHVGKFEVIKEHEKSKLTKVDVKNISPGGLCIASKKEFIKNQDFELIIPKIKTLDSVVLKCRVTRSYFMESVYEYEIGLKFIPPNTDYLKQLVSVLQA